MRIIRHTLNNRIRDAVLIVLSVLLIGLVPLQDVFAATEEVSIPYRQIWSNRSGENVNNSFEYRLTAVDGAPLPNEASGGYYSFVLTGNTGGNLNLHFPFASPGYYNYQVRAYIPNREAYYSYDDNTYNLMIMVINTDSGLGIGAMTIQDSTLAKYSELPFSMAYNKAPPANAGAVNGGAGGAAGGAPGAVPADTTVIDDTVPPEILPDEDTPQGILPEPDNWALLNLILLVLTIIVALADGAMYFIRPTDKYGDEYEEDEDEEIKRHGLLRILAFITAIASFILFILTEDITQPMIWVDEYTIWMLILFIATVLLSMLSKKEYEGEESEQGAT